MPTYLCTGRAVISDQDGSVRVWVPVVELTTRTGVLAVTVPHAGPQVLAQAELLGVFAGLAVAAAARVSDVPHLRRRGRAMSLPAVMQWDMLPPLSARTAGPGRALRRYFVRHRHHRPAGHRVRTAGVVMIASPFGMFPGS